MICSFQGAKRLARLWKCKQGYLETSFLCSYTNFTYGLFLQYLQLCSHLFFLHLPPCVHNQLNVHHMKLSAQHIVTMVCRRILIYLYFIQKTMTMKKMRGNLLALFKSEPFSLFFVFLNHSQRRLFQTFGPPWPETEQIQMEIQAITFYQMDH